jgi:hypothetical protein
MSWSQIRLGDIAIFRNGINFGKESYGKGVSLIGVSDFKNRFYPDYETLDEVKESVVGVNDYLDYGDIVFVRSNGNKELVGRCMLINTTKPKVTYSGFCIRTRIKDSTEHDSIFWTYHFKNISFRKAMSGNAIGTNIQNLSQGMLSNYEAEVPDYNTQRRIASILSTYDDLIENNQKQIKLLEEAAQRLYKEWFIDLRFPGHENVEVVDGVPEGWNIGILGDIGTFKRGKTITKAKIVEGEVPVISGGLGPAYYHNESNTSSPVITVSGSGANAGFTRLYYTKVFASDCSFVDIEQTPYLYWIYLFLKNNSSRLDMLQKGSAQPHVYAKDINALECIIPMKEILNLFCELVSLYFDIIGILDKQIIRLTEARDRLLPKLMSGEIEV